MAEADEELELDVNQAKGNKMTTILLIVLIVLVLIIGGVGAWLFLGKDDASSGSDAEGEKAEEALGPLTYLTLVPEFVVNFGPGSKVRYLQVDLQISSRNEAALKTVNTYRPVLRNDILVLLSGLTFDELKVRDGKEMLQKKILNTVNQVVTTAMNSGKEKSKGAEGNEDTAETATEVNAADEKVKGPIENVYFTSFIMQ